jgi:hypothetical protein
MPRSIRPALPRSGGQRERTYARAIRLRAGHQEPAIAS